MRLNKTTQKTRTGQEKGRAREDILKQMYFTMKDENGVTLKYSNLRTNAV
jgi:hypothetical protein